MIYNELFESHTFGKFELPFIFSCTTLKNFVCTDTNWHPNIEIIYVESGSGTINCGKAVYSLGAGDIFVINSNLPHGIGTDKTIRYYYLIPDHEFCLSNGIDTNRIKFRNYVQSDEALRLFSNIISEYGENAPYRSTAIRLHVLEFMLYLVRFCRTEEDSFGNSSAREDNIRLSIGYIYANFDRQMTLDEIAAEVGLSKYYFTREFKRLTGKTPFEFICDLRCEYAIKLMSNGVSSVREICGECGFENLSYFSKVFRKYTGLSPKEYIKSNNN